MSDLRLAIINGTGPATELYDQVMADSFCRQLANGLGERAYYQRGPSILGLEVHKEALAAFAWLRSEHHHDPSLRLMVTGYSRGGSAAIMVCELLAADGIEVDSLFLFDAVARHEFSHGKVIPANVRFSRHARRSHARDFVMKYEGTIHRMGMFGGVENPVRPSFGNTGLHWHGDGDHHPAEVFMGSHGALGGVGWSMVEEDQQCEVGVAEWMNRHLHARGVEVELKGGVMMGAVSPAHPNCFEHWLAHNVYQFLLPTQDGAAVMGGEAGLFMGVPTYGDYGAPGQPGDQQRGGGPQT
jgi:hypothetical protein